MFSVCLHFSLSYEVGVGFSSARHSWLMQFGSGVLYIFCVHIEDIDAIGKESDLVVLS